MKRSIGRLEAQLLAYAQMRRWTTVRTGDLRKPMRLSADQERKLFSRLARAGMIARVWRGLYLVPPRLPLGGKWSPDEVEPAPNTCDHPGARWCGVRSLRTIPNLTSPFFARSRGNYDDAGNSGEGLAVPH